jgi:polyisoprenyl-teichoic acid--peptidoglycan teichoic acid transferase
VRVNTLLVLGEAMHQGYGPRFAIETIQANLGLYIDAYAAFDFEAFISIVDALGGVDVDVPYNIYDAEFPDMRYRFDPLYLRAGMQHLDGYDALRYSRTRHQDSDYQRGDRQIQVLSAIRQRLAQPNVARGLIAQAPALMSSLEGHIHTNIPLDLAITLGGQLALLDESALITGSLDESNTYAYNGMRIPDRNQLVDVLTAVFGAKYNL